MTHFLDSVSGFGGLLREGLGLAGAGGFRTGDSERFLCLGTSDETFLLEKIIILYMHDE